MSISDKTYGSPFTMEQIETINPVSTPESELIYYLVCGETVVNYSTGARYQRNDYIYGKFALLNGAKDEVDLRGIVIYRDYDTPPLADGVSEGFYYELLQTNKGNDIAGVIGTETQLASIQSNYTGAYTDLNTSKFIANDYHGLLAAGPWNTIGLHYADVRSQEDLTSFIVINQNPTEETYHYQYVSRGSVVKEGDLVIGATPTAPSNPASYESGNYRYTFSKWELSMSGKDHTYTAIFTSSPITMTVIWQNWNGTELQRKTYNKGSSEPSYSGSTPTRPNDSNYTYTFSGWTLVSSSTYSKTYKAQYTSKPLYHYGAYNVMNGFLWEKFTVVNNAKGTKVGAVSSTSSSAYPANGKHTDNYWYTRTSDRATNVPNFSSIVNDQIYLTSPLTTKYPSKTYNDVSYVTDDVVIPNWNGDVSATYRFDYDFSSFNTTHSGTVKVYNLSDGKLYKTITVNVPSCKDGHTLMTVGMSYDETIFALVVASPIERDSSRNEDYITIEIFSMTVGSKLSAQPNSIVLSQVVSPLTFHDVSRVGGVSTTTEYALPGHFQAYGAVLTYFKLRYSGNDHYTFISIIIYSAMLRPNSSIAYRNYTIDSINESRIWCHTYNAYWTSPWYPKREGIGLVTQWEYSRDYNQFYFYGRYCNTDGNYGGSYGDSLYDRGSLPKMETMHDCIFWASVRNSDNVYDPTSAQFLANNYGLFLQYSGSGAGLYRMTSELADTAYKMYLMKLSGGEVYYTFYNPPASKTIYILKKNSSGKLGYADLVLPTSGSWSMTDKEDDRLTAIGQSISLPNPSTSSTYKLPRTVIDPTNHFYLVDSTIGQIGQKEVITQSSVPSPGYQSSQYPGSILYPII